MAFCVLILSLSPCSISSFDKRQYRAALKGVAFPEDDEKEMRVLTQEEQQRFIAALDGEYYKVMLLTYLYAGMRAGECIPLQWRDIDLSKRTIRVNKKAILNHDFAKHSAKQEIQHFCKTKSSKRTVTITEGLTAILAEHKENMRERAEALGLEWSEDSIIRRKDATYEQQSFPEIYRRVVYHGIPLGQVGRTIEPQGRLPRYP